MATLSRPDLAVATAYERPVVILRVVTRPRRPVYPELGELDQHTRTMLVAAGVVRDEEGNVP